MEKLLLFNDNESIMISHNITGKKIDPDRSNTIKIIRIQPIFSLVNLTSHLIDVCSLGRFKIQTCESSSFKNPNNFCDFPFDIPNK